MEIAFGPYFIFSIDTTLFDEVQRESPERFSTHDRVGQRPTLQHIGTCVETATIPGAVFQCFIGDNTVMNDLYAIKESGEAQELWTMTSKYAGERFMEGRWVITNITETKKHFKASGKASVIDYSLSLSRYD